MELRGRGSRGTWGCWGMNWVQWGVREYAGDDGSTVAGFGREFLLGLVGVGFGFGVIAILVHASLLDSLRKLPVDLAFAVDFQSCVRYRLASLLDSLRKLPVDLAFAVDFQSCVRYRLVLNKVGTAAYKLELPQELSRIHNTFHVSNFKKCHADEPLAVPLDGLHFDDKLHFVEEPVETMDREVKRLNRSHIPLVKVRWNSRRGPEFT
nr:putative reverse transcriptase domain-containing protein [Tanacetum cinerariifolium]